MNIDRASFEALTRSSSYQNLPLQMAQESGYSVWWAQVGHMTRTAAKMCVWEVATAMEACFETYEGLGLEIRMRWSVPRDMDPSGKKCDILVNGRFYERGNSEIESALHNKIAATDDFAALNLLEKVANAGLLSNRKLIADDLQEALGMVSFTHANQARQAKQEHAAEVGARIEALLLEQASPSGQAMRPAHRM